jgi:hypothetical protein
VIVAVLPLGLPDSVRLTLIIGSISAMFWRLHRWINAQEKPGEQGADKWPSHETHVSLWRAVRCGHRCLARPRSWHSRSSQHRAYLLCVGRDHSSSPQLDVARLRRVFSVSQLKLHHKSQAAVQVRR